MKAAKPVMRRIKRHYGVTAKRVTVKSQRPWYWRMLLPLAFILLGYGICYWQLVKGGFHNSVQAMGQQNQSLLAKIAQNELLLQFERAARNTLSKELASLQDEDMRLKEDLAFYKSILEKPDGKSELKLDGFKVIKAAQPGRYEYHILLMQSGRPSKAVQGTLELKLVAMQAGKTVTLPLTDEATGKQAVAVDFKYYQRVDGYFRVASDVEAQSVVASFIETGASQPRISQSTDLHVR